MFDLQENVSLKNYTSLRIGGPAEFFCMPSNLESLRTAVVWSKMHNKEITLIGGGTNTLISDEGIKGLVICTRKLFGITSQVEGDLFRVEALAGTPKTLLFKEFLKHKLAPAEFLAGLPGDIAAGVVMNAGISSGPAPREFCEIVEWVEVLREGHLVRLAREDLNFSYRKSRGWQPGIIYKAGFSWPNQEDPELPERVRALNKFRLEKQPLELPNAGSVFMNPPGHRSGKLIDECGLKGYRVGDAMVSEKHANFIVNVGQAKATDVLQLIKHIQDTVLEHKGVALQPEWRLVGF